MTDDGAKDGSDHADNHVIDQSFVGDRIAGLGAGPAKRRTWSSAAGPWAPISHAVPTDRRSYLRSLESFDIDVGRLAAGGGERRQCTD